jgi:hypothetical protein
MQTNIPSFEKSKKTQTQINLGLTGMGPIAKYIKYCNYAWEYQTGLYMLDFYEKVIFNLIVLTVLYYSIRFVVI